ncbi:MAG: hypothetical protein IGS48_12655 [Oscillatoriales cyanobacterium C42_A2020_001]|nr:hypothetical protein [Leptolyngbyaceae cyanobacterium C42_A2020_001]
MAAKPFRWAIAVSSLAFSFGVSEVVNALPGDPSFFCHERTVYGQIINRNGMCSQNPNLPIKEPVETSDKPVSKTPSSKRVVVEREAKEMMDFSELSYEDGILSGSVKNRTRETMSNGAIQYEVRASKDKVNWKTIGMGSACFVDDELGRGKMTAFQSSVPSNGDKIIITSVGSSSRCGTTISRSSSLSSTGKCTYSWQKDSAGRLCGRRAKYK